MNLVGIIYFLFAISFICYLLTAAVLYKSKRNPMIFLFCVSGMFICLSALSSLLYDHKGDLKRAVKTNFQDNPSTMCFVRGAVVQMAAYMTEITATCFSYHAYRVLVMRRSDDLRGGSMKLIYYISIVLYTFGMGTLVLVLAAKFRAIQPFLIICDLKGPNWIRLIGFSGSNLILSIPGIYWSVRSALIVFKHAERFKSRTVTNKSSSNTQNPLLSKTGSNGVEHDKINSPNPSDTHDPNEHATNEHSTNEHSTNEHSTNEHATNEHEKSENETSEHAKSENETSEHAKSENATSEHATIDITANKAADLEPTPMPPLKVENRSETPGKQTKRYNITRNAAIRMIVFAVLFVFVNLLASLQTILDVLHDRKIDPSQVRSADFAGSLTGILVFTIFGTGVEGKRIMRQWRRRIY